MDNIAQKNRIKKDWRKSHSKLCLNDYAIQWIVSGGALKWRNNHPISNHAKISNKINYIK